MILIALTTLVIIAGDGKISTAPVPSAQCAYLASFAMFGENVADHAAKTVKERVFVTCPPGPVMCPTLPDEVNVFPPASAYDPSRQFVGADGDVHLLSEPKTAGCLP